MTPKVRKSTTKKFTAASKTSSKAKQDNDASSEPEPAIVESKNDKIASDDQSEEGSLEIGACCLCHSSMDFTDRAAFFRADRMEDFNEDTDNEDEYYFRPNDPYLDVQLYDPNNALLYCDGCNRLFHQKCHFCPVTVVPRGEWHCLLCTYFAKNNSPNKGKQKAPRRKQKSSSAAASSSLPGIVSKTAPKLYHQMYEAFTTQQLFVSPPVSAVEQLEQAWEFESRHLKSTHFQSHVIKRLKQYVESQASGYRLAETAVVTLTSTSKNRNHFFKSTSSSQELAQTLVRLYGIRKNWRQACYMLHDLQRATDTKWNLLQAFCDQADPEFVTRVLFPFGRQHGRRVEPRTAEAKLAWGEMESKHSPPTEIVVGKAEKGKKKTQPQTAAKRTSKKVAAAAKKDDDSGISLDDLQCCVCRTSEATDENDLVLCDGEGCFRAYHAHCVSPALKESDLEENIDWFCPYCSAVADIFLAVQTVHMGDEWEQERYAAMLKDKEMDSSLQSWSAVEQVFPTAEQDYVAACQMKEGKRNKATDDLLARVLGIEQLPDHDDDDEVLDKNFDLDSFQKEREEIRKKRNESDEESKADYEDGDDESSHSSQATLVEMSSVELEVGKAELDALSKASSDDEDEDAEESNRRRSRRLRKSIEEAKGKHLVNDIGEFNEANIVEGKRGRKPVDYITLNQAIFGDVPDEDAAVLDDPEEFYQSSRNKAASSGDDGSDEKSDGEDGCDTEEENVEEDETSQKSGTNSVSQDRSIDKNSDKKKKLASKSPANTKNGRKRQVGKNGKKQGSNKKPRRSCDKTSSAAKQVSSPKSKTFSSTKHPAEKGRKRKVAQKNGAPARVTRSKEEISKLTNGITSKSNVDMKSTEKSI